jgi:hypothetical protein
VESSSVKQNSPLALYAALAGASLWILTEILEMLAPTGHTALSLWLTTIWHPVLALGFWGLHKAQSSGKNTFSLVATIVVMTGLLAFAPLSVMYLHSGTDSFDAFIQQRPYFVAAGFLMAIGLVLFAAAMIRSRYYPAWMAYGVIGAFVLTAMKRLGGFPELLQHTGFILLSLIIIGMAAIALRKSAGGLLDTAVAAST